MAMPKEAVCLAQGAAQPLCGAAWAPDSQALLVANAGSRQLVALYFTQQPPGMEAQPVPVALPARGAHSADCRGSGTIGADAVFVRRYPVRRCTAVEGCWILSIGELVPTRRRARSKCLAASRV